MMGNSHFDFIASFVSNFAHLGVWLEQLALREEKPFSKFSRDVSKIKMKASHHVKISGSVTEVLNCKKNTTRGAGSCGTNILEFRPV